MADCAASGSEPYVLERPSCIIERDRRRTGKQLGSGKTGLGPINLTTINRRPLLDFPVASPGSLGAWLHHRRGLCARPLAVMPRGSDMDIGHIAPMVIVGLVLGLFGWGRAHLGQTVAMQ